MYSDDDYIMLSAINHYVHCPRRCGLIHVYGLWSDNMFTSRGNIMHERADSEENEWRDEKHIVRSLIVISKRLGLSGKADIVEFTDDDGIIIPYPVEYKSGKPKKNISDSAQLCAQAMCLEEMMNLSIEKAAFYYGTPRKRYEIDITEGLRNATEDIIIKVHDMVKNRKVPEAKYEKKCNTCSLKDLCMPGTGRKKVSWYIKGLYSTNEEAS
ncbi:MAG: CRISPR-associated protein Cas4 [Spirochaetes bacterium]|nr:CRISPR-associated protein Cas4 [Spirochaetota bacterium]